MDNIYNISDNSKSLKPNKLYRNYAIAALVCNLLYIGLSIYGFSLANIFSSFIEDIFYIPTNHLTSPVHLLSWFALIGVYISVRGFARAQISAEDAASVRIVSYGILVAIAAMAIIPINSYFPKIHYYFCEFLQYISIAISLWGIFNLCKSKHQSDNARKGFKFIMLFIALLIPIYLFRDLLTTINFLVIGIDSSFYFGLIAFTNFIIVIVNILLVWGAIMIIRSRSEVDRESYDALCKANDEATSEQRSLRIWLYGMGLIAIYSVLFSLYVICHDVAYLVEPDIYIGEWDGFGTLTLSQFGTITTATLALWMLLNSNIRHNKGMKFSLVGIIISELLLGYIQIIKPIYDGSIFTILFIILTIVCMIIFCISQLLFVWRSGLKRYTKIALSIIWPITNFAVAWISEDIFLLLSILEVVILMISAALITPNAKYKWVKWATIVFTAFFVCLSLSYFLLVRHKIKEYEKLMESNKECVTAIECAMPMAPSDAQATEYDS